MPNIGKKLHKFKYTYKEIANATGLSYNTVRIYASQGKFNPYDLIDTAKFIIIRRNPQITILN